jgi:hypothetical protein
VGEAEEGVLGRRDLRQVDDPQRAAVDVEDQREVIGGAAATNANCS